MSVFATEMACGRASAPEIIEAVARAFGFGVADIVGPCQARDVSFARFAACVLLRDAGLTFSAIGRRLGGRDHKTIMHALTRAAEIGRVDGDYRYRLSGLRAVLLQPLVFRSRRVRA